MSESLVTNLSKSALLIILDSTGHSPSAHRAAQPQLSFVRCADWTEKLFVPSPHWELRTRPSIFKKRIHSAAMSLTEALSLHFGCFAFSLPATQPATPLAPP